MKSLRVFACGATQAQFEVALHVGPLVRQDAEHHRITEIAVRHADELADGLLLLIEGSYVSGQAFGERSLARVLGAMARRLIEASLASR